MHLSSKFMRFLYFVSLFLYILTFDACGARNKDFIEEDQNDGASDAGLENESDAGSPILVNALFGIVYPRTGLTSEQCAPEHSQVVLNEETGNKELHYFTGLYTQAQINRLKTMVLDSSSPHLSKLPYLPSALDDSPWNHQEHYTIPPAGTVCGLKIIDASNSDAIRYSLDTYESKVSAEMDGARVTHLGNCGHCSSVSDLAMLLEIPDRTRRMRTCALKLLSAEAKVGVLNCIQEFGISDNCIMAWYYNAIYTQEKCTARCLKYADANYHNSDGSLNDCMICNTEYVDELFKVIAGRRDDAQPISMCRTITEDEWICHNYADNFENLDSCVGIGKPKLQWSCTIKNYDKSLEKYDLDECIQSTE